MTTCIRCSMMITAMFRSTDPLDKVDQIIAFARIHAGGRFIEQQKGWIGRERAGDLEPSLIAVREIFSQFIAGREQADKLKRLLAGIADLFFFAAEQSVSATAPRRVRISVRL